MPYQLKKTKGNKYVIVKKGTGKVIAGNKTPLTKEKAVAAMRARYATEAGTQKKS